VHNRDRKKAHITILKTELVYISAAIILVAFVLGYFAGISKGGAVFELEALPDATQGASNGSITISPSLTDSFATTDNAEEPENQSIVNINTADAEEMTTLPGIGQVLAERIIAYREANGGFKNIYELMDVSGIGEKTFAKLQDFISVD